MQWTVYKGVMVKVSYLRWYLLAGLIGAMCWIFLAPNPLPLGIEIQRELGFVGHVLAFSTLSLACLTLFPRHFRQTIYMLVIIAISLEAAQLLLSSRGADVIDFIMNIAGIVIGGGLFRSMTLVRSRLL